MTLMKEWKKEAEERLKKGSSVKSLKKCPRCNAHDFEFDSKTGRLRCKKCGFEVYVKVT